MHHLCYLSPELLAAIVLTGCQIRPQGKFTAEKIATMRSYGFSELNGDWSLGLSDKILFGKNDYRLRADKEQKIDAMASKLSTMGLKHARMDGHTDNYGDDGYNEALALKRADAVEQVWADGAKVPRSNLTTQGLGKKYPIASNQTAEGQAANRRVAIVITGP
ncbi:membrane protein [Trabulsiella odontotermitis]|uniref:Membrane protein n=1 Tax=Trabulsiella odontotermitis TaxID=379893 RepID=A0A0L0GU66_9ENTR|nr:membrane protein [Trabulsiella odontotermitis]